MANNESGHFKPKQSCLAYLRQTLKDFGVPVDANAVFDDFARPVRAKPASRYMTSFSARAPAEEHHESRRNHPDGDHRSRW
jgi:hypothetical protein